MSSRVREALAAFDPSLPLERAHTIPGTWYHDLEIAELERRFVFGGSWQVAARTDQVARPGCFATADLAGEPILIVRGDDGVLRAFFNVCRHRAARVMEPAEGCADRLRCRYHGWTYDLAGRLRGTPEFDGVADFPREQNGLVPLSVATWGPFVWVHPSPNPRPLEQVIEPAARRVAHLGVESLRFVERREYSLACNWKVFVDNYLDGGYHVNTVHPDLADALDYTRYHTEVEGSVSVQISPLRSADASTGAVRTGAAAYYAFVFPNFMFNVYDGLMDTNQVFPVDVNHCRVIFGFYFAETEGAEAAARNARSIEVGHQIQLEDVGICEDVQRGMASRSYRFGRYSVRREAGVYQFHQLLARTLQQANVDYLSP